jgi:hypothetical protein
VEQPELVIWQRCHSTIVPRRQPSASTAPLAER